jgi:hypothetical protein
MRAEMSPVPPAAVPRITRTGLTGYVCPALIEEVCADASTMQSPAHATTTPISFRTIS